MTIDLIEEVSTGEVRTSRGDRILVSNALGSCVAVVAFDSVMRIGGIAHVMLPGTAGHRHGAERLRYAEESIEELLHRVKALGSQLSNLATVLAGGGNVLYRPDDTICTLNIQSVTEILRRLAIPVLARSLGGTKRRRVKLDLASGCVFCAVGEDEEHVLWRLAI